MYKIILNIKNNQFIVSIGSILNIDKLDKQIGEELQFKSVMMIIDEDKVHALGNPFIKGIIVKAVVVCHFKNNKMRIIKFRRRKHYKLTKGHRQSLTKIQIKDIYIPRYI